MDSDGTLLSIIHYWPLEVHDAAGVAHHAGRISHVFTREDARRQGHATRLLELTLAAMRDDGCQWSLLSASEEGRPLYEHYGWRPLPYRQVRCPVSEQPSPSRGPYTVCPYDPRREPAGWSAIKRIHQAYNAGRPFTTIRDDAYWQNVAARVDWWLSSANGAWRAVMFVTTRDGGDTPRAYALAFFFAEGGFLLAELGALPGDEEALPALLAIIAAQPGGRTGGRLYLPHEPALEAALAERCGDMRCEENDECMMRVIDSEIDERLLTTLPTVPGSVMWLLDDI